jgi:dihydrofolate synthase/folylpolyglutamate synthase
VPVTFESAIAKLLELGQELAVVRKFDLDHMRTLAAALGNHQRRFPSVLIAGTNGKGSTAATLASIMQAAGYRTGLYTSPHLLHVNERIQIDQEPISNAEFSVMFERVENAATALVAQGSLPWHPSFFEMLTAIALEYFASAGVDLAVLEVGLGGRLDATNIVDPLLSIITDIDFDHQKFLGNTLPEIAREKAGIIRRDGLVVLLPQHPQVNDTLGHCIEDLGAVAVNAAKFMPPLTPDARDPMLTRFPIVFGGKEIHVASPLVGRHQFRNVALAITAAEQLKKFGFTVLPEHVEEGVRTTVWPGRFQVMPRSGDFPEAVLDVAHNPAGAWALRSALSTFYEDRPLTFVFGAMRDKAIAEIAGILFPLAERVIATQAHNTRAASTAEIVEAAQQSGVEAIAADTVQHAVELAGTLAGEKGVVVITGSIYIVGEALGVLSHHPAGQNI